MPFEIENGVLKKYTAEPGVTAVTIPDGVTEIGVNAFRMNRKLKSIIISKGVRVISEYAFGFCETLNRIVFEEGVETIHKYAFMCCNSLSSVVLPQSLKRMEQAAFDGCRNLTQVILPEGLTRIEGKLFRGCKRLTLIRIPQGVKSIGSQAFQECKMLTELRFPDTIQNICTAVCQDCNNLTHVFLPQNVKHIGCKAFAGCWKLTVIQLCPDDPAIQRDYYNVSDLESCLESAFQMLRTGDYTVKIAHTVKYPFLILHYLHTHDEKLAAYIKMNLTRMMRECIPAGDVCFIAELVQSEQFFNKRNLDSYIELAQEHEQTEILMLLMNYKNAHLGFGTSKKLRL